VGDLGKDPHEKRHHFDANPDPDRNQHGNLDPDRHENDADPQHRFQAQLPKKLICCCNILYLSLNRGCEILECFKQLIPSIQR
jgi:hypothetical protein